jgi:hypothetical protein
MSSVSQQCMRHLIAEGSRIFCYSSMMNTASLFADPNLLQLEFEAMINTDDAQSQRSADATAPLAPKARENPFQNAKINYPE